MLRAWAVGLALWTACAGAWAAGGDTAKERREDFDAMWRAIDSRYAYFEGRRAQWRAARDGWRKKAAAARSREELVAALEGALAVLHDDHVTLSAKGARSPRRVPQETDIWAAWRGGHAVVESVRFAGQADYAGLHPGDEVARIEGVPVERAVKGYLHDDRSSARDQDWALRRLLAGPRTGTFTLDLSGREPRHLEIERNGRPPAPTPSVMARRIGEARDIGYLRLRNLQEPRLLFQLESALAQLGDARVLIVDLREVDEGPREVTRAILARFAVREAPWQIRAGRDGKRDADRITPAAKPAFSGPIVVLGDRWTAGEGEALVAGFASIAAARFVGTPMAGMRGELKTVRLPHSGLEVRFPAEKVFLPDGTPREALRPHVEVNLAEPSGGPGDPILYQALKLVEK